MNAQEIIDYIANSEKKTPVKVYVNTTAPVDFGSATVFGSGGSFTVFGDWSELGPILEANAGRITDCVVEHDRRNSGVPLLDLKGVQARIEPGAIIREKVEIGQGAVIMMGAVINIGAVVGPGTMIDMGAVLGGRATVGARCHIGAGAVRLSLWRTASLLVPTPWSSRGSISVLAPWWPPGRWSLRTCPPTPWWPAALPGSSK